MNWKDIFEVEYEKHQGVNEHDLNDFLKNWNQNLSTSQIKELKNSPAFNKNITLNFPNKQLPDSYIDFLKFSNGGFFENGDRYFQFFNTEDFREMNIAYELTLYMPNAVSFAMDGCGNHYIFDMRKESVNGEYPVIVSHSSILEFETAKLIGNSFIEVCLGKVSIDKILSED